MDLLMFWQVFCEEQGLEGLIPVPANIQSTWKWILGSFQILEDWTIYCILTNLWVLKSSEFFGGVSKHPWELVLNLEQKIVFWKN